MFYYGCQTARGEVYTPQVSTLKDKALFIVPPEGYKLRLRGGNSGGVLKRVPAIR